jgi:hypothetical protein
VRGSSAVVWCGVVVMLVVVNLPVGGRGVLEASFEPSLR